MINGHSDYEHWDKTYPAQLDPVIMPASAKQLLLAGVTSARDLGGPLEPSIAVRDRISRHTEGTPAHPTQTFAASMRPTAGPHRAPDPSPTSPPTRHRPRSCGYRIRLMRGRGVSAASRSRNSMGSNTRWVVPSDHRRRNVSWTCPSLVRRQDPLPHRLCSSGHVGGAWQSSDPTEGHDTGPIGRSVDSDRP
jgi:hypothetical protein